MAQRYDLVAMGLEILRATLAAEVNLLPIHLLLRARVLGLKRDPAVETIARVALTVLGVTARLTLARLLLFRQR